MNIFIILLDWWYSFSDQLLIYDLLFSISLKQWVGIHLNFDLLRGSTPECQNYLLHFYVKMPIKIANTYGTFAQQIFISHNQVKFTRFKYTTSKGKAGINKIQVTQLWIRLTTWLILTHCIPLFLFVWRTTYISGIEPFIFFLSSVNIFHQRCNHYFLIVS